jgi:hypothetical protein
MKLVQQQELEYYIKLYSENMEDIAVIRKTYCILNDLLWEMASFNSV